MLLGALLQTVAYQVEGQVFIHHALNDGLNQAQQAQRVSGNLDLHCILEMGLGFGNKPPIEYMPLQSSTDNLLLLTDKCSTS